jgi:hypothetical protein
MCDLHWEGLHKTVGNKSQIRITLESARERWKENTLKLILCVEIEVKMMYARFMFLSLCSSCGLKEMWYNLVGS